LLTTLTGLLGLLIWIALLATLLILLFLVLIAHQSILSRTSIKLLGAANDVFSN
jgi:hypothetical protein